MATRYVISATESRREVQNERQALAGSRAAKYRAAAAAAARLEQPRESSTRAHTHSQPGTRARRSPARSTRAFLFRVYTCLTRALERIPRVSARTARRLQLADVTHAHARLALRSFSPFSCCILRRSCHEQSIISRLSRDEFQRPISVRLILGAFTTQNVIKLRSQCVLPPLASLRSHRERIDDSINTFSSVFISPILSVRVSRAAAPAAREGARYGSIRGTFR